MQEREMLYLTENKVLGVPDQKRTFNEIEGYF